MNKALSLYARQNSALVPMKVEELKKISSREYVEDIAVGRKDMMNMFMEQNPDLAQDRLFFTVAEYAAFLVPLSGILGQLVVLMGSKAVDSVFKKKYLNKINNDDTLVALINELGVKPKNLNSTALKEISKIANAQNASNRGSLVPRGTSNKYQNVVLNAKDNSQRRKLRFMMFADTLSRTASMIYIIMNLMYYLMVVTADLAKQKAVTEESLTLVVNLLVRYFFVVRAAMPTLAIGVANKTIKSFEGISGLKINGPLKSQFVQLTGAASIALIGRYAQLPNIMRLLYKGTNRLLAAQDAFISSMGANSDLYSMIYSLLDPGVGDALFDGFQVGFRSVRDFLKMTSMVMATTMVVAGISLARPSSSRKNIVRN